MKRLILLVLFFAVSAYSAIGPAGSNWRISWRPNTEGDLAWYRVCANGVYHVVSLPNTSLLFTNIQETTSFSVTAHDTSGNSSEPSMTVWVVMEQGVVFKTVYTVEDLSDMFGGGTASINGNFRRFGLWDNNKIDLSVDVEASGVYEVSINASQKDPGARLCVNGSWMSTLTPVKSIHRVRISLNAGLSEVSILADGDVHLWDEVFSLKYIGAGIIDTTPPGRPEINEPVREE